MTPEKAAELRKAFPSSSVGKIPKGGVMLDYVGHAAVSDRLLSVDPDWTWEPMGTDEHGLPALDKAGNLWIKLTVCGVTRIGVGDGKSAKEAIGDGIRNAAMRFGVALDLWSKEELESSHDQPAESSVTQSLSAPQLAAEAMEEGATAAGLRLLYAEAKQFGLLGELVPDADGEMVTLGSLITARGKALRGAA